MRNLQSTWYEDIFNLIYIDVLIENMKFTLHW
jgi:hypothetical protein